MPNASAAAARRRIAPPLVPADQRAGGNKILAPNAITGAIEIQDGSNFKGNTGPANSSYDAINAVAVADTTNLSAILTTPAGSHSRFYSAISPHW